ncbi:MAG: hypothetical protein HOJ35_06795 [Bdellovibrionales bacterium]|nr:hypothetical protein [Bdellovibrionales bacterium]
MKFIFFLILLIPLSSCQNNKEIHIAIMDTGICPLDKKYKNIIVKKQIDASNETHGTKYLEKICVAPQHPRQLHGDKLFRFFAEEISQFNLNIIFHITPIKIYNTQTGKSSFESVKKALKIIKDKNMNFIISAVGIEASSKQLNKIKEQELIIFAASGNKSNSKILWPQSLDHKLLLFGNYTPSNYLNNIHGFIGTTQGFVSKTNFFLPITKNLIKGTSFSVYQGATKAIQNCSKELLIKDFLKISNCLKKYSKDLKLKINKMMIKTKGWK